jgi:hypothetical protein
MSQAALTSISKKNTSVIEIEQQGPVKSSKNTTKADTANLFSEGFDLQRIEFLLVPALVEKPLS